MSVSWREKDSRAARVTCFSPTAGEYSRTNSAAGPPLGCPQAPVRRKAVERGIKRACGRQLSTPVESRVEARKSPANRGDRPPRTRQEILIERGPGRCYARQPYGSSKRSGHSGGAANRACGGTSLERRLGSAARSAQ